METFSALLALGEGNPPGTGGFPSQRPVTRSFDAFFHLRLNNGWANNRDADELRRHRAHYDITVMSFSNRISTFQLPFLLRLWTENGSISDMVCLNFHRICVMVKQDFTILEFKISLWRIFHISSVTASGHRSITSKSVTPTAPSCKD